jgi:hypothetical protein
MNRIGYLLICILIMTLMGYTSLKAQEPRKTYINITSFPVEAEITIVIANKAIKVGNTPIKTWVTRPGLEYFVITAKPVGGNFPEQQVEIRREDPVPMSLHFNFSK